MAVALSLIGCRQAPITLRVLDWRYGEQVQQGEFTVSRTVDHNPFLPWSDHTESWEHQFVTGEIALPNLRPSDRILISVDNYYRLTLEFRLRELCLLDSVPPEDEDVAVSFLVDEHNCIRIPSNRIVAVPLIRRLR